MYYENLLYSSYLVKEVLKCVRYGKTKNEKGRVFMKKAFKIIIFVLSLISFLISVVLFYNLGIFADEHNLSPEDVCGGKLELIFDWIRLLLLGLLCLLSGISLLRKEK